MLLTVMFVRKTDGSFCLTRWKHTLLCDGHCDYLLCVPLVLSCLARISSPRLCFPSRCLACVFDSLARTRPLPGMYVCVTCFACVVCCVSHVCGVCDVFGVCTYFRQVCAKKFIVIVDDSKFVPGLGISG